MIPRDAEQGRGPETGDGDTLRKLFSVCYHSESLELGEEKSKQTQRNPVGCRGLGQKGQQFWCRKDSVNEQTAICGAHPEVGQQVFCQLFISAITTDGHRSGDAGGGACSRESVQGSSSGRWAPVLTILRTV